MSEQRSDEPVFISSNGELLAHISGHRLAIKTLQTLHVIETFTCDGVIGHVEWSEDSKMVLCIMRKESLVQVFWVFEPHQNMRFSVGAGISVACFTPDNKSVLVALCLDLNVCIYRLYSKSRYIFPGARILSNCLPGIAFSPDGKLLVIAERQQSRLTVYSCVSWNALQHLQYTDVKGMSWSPDSACLAVWGDRYKFRLHVFLLDGRHMYSKCSSDAAVQNAVWSMCGNMLVISKWHCRDFIILNCLTWSVIADLQPSRALLEAGLHIVEDVNVLDIQLEPETCPPLIAAHLCNRKFPRPENKLLTFSQCGKFLSVADGFAVWVWSCGRLVSLLQYSEHVSSLTWDEDGHLLILTSEKRVVKWNSRNQKLSRLAITC